MTTPHLPGTRPHPSRPSSTPALLMLQQMGLSPGDLVTAPGTGRRYRPSPSTSRWCPLPSPTAPAGRTARTGTALIDHWGERRLDEIAPSEIRQLMSYVKTHVVARRNARGGRSAAEHLVAALRCLYKHAEDDGLITRAENPARKVDKPRRLPSTRRAVTDDRLAEICQAAATTGDDPELDTLLLRLHTETACRRGGALALRPDDLDSGPVPDPAARERRDRPLAAGLAHLDGPPHRARPGAARPARRATAALPQRAAASPPAAMTTCGPASAAYLPWVRTQQISMHWIRHILSA